MHVWRVLAVVTVAFGLLAVLSAARGARAAGANGGIEGHVKLTGEAPKPETVKITRSPEVCGAEHVSERVIVSKDNRGLKNVAVLLHGPNETAAPEGAEIGLDQKGCTYLPHVQVTTPGASLTITNSDPTFHNVHAYQVESESKRPTLFNLAQPPGAAFARKTVVLDKAGLVEFTCDVHPWMRAYVLVHDNAYFAVTDESGHYAIPGVPPGDYTLSIWHEAGGELEQRKVKVEAGKTVTVNFPIETIE